MFTHVRDCIIIYCFQSTFISDTAPAILPHRVRRACDDRVSTQNRGLKYLHETLKILPQKPETIVIDELAGHLASIGAIHYTSNQIRPG